MAVYPKISDNEMNYFQNKARQMLLLKKEDREWQNLCKQFAPECAACLSEKADSKVSKDIGIQASPKKVFNKIGRTTLEPKYKNDQIPEALNNIKTRLERIDFALSKIYDVSHESDKEKKSEVTSLFRNEKTLKSLEEQKKLLIQNSLKASLQKIHTSCLRTSKNPPSTVKLKNPSYFLPHDLQVKRAAARKAYLISLQTKPKVSFRNMSQNNSAKSVQNTQNKKSVLKHSSKSKLKKKSMPKKEKEIVEDKEETLVATDEAQEPKDENIECIVDGILEDLIGEAAMDLNKIKQWRKHSESNVSNNANIDKVKKANTVLDSITSTQTKNTKPKVLVNDADSSITKLKLFFDSSKQDQEKNGNSKKEELLDKRTSTFPVENPESLVDETSAKERDIGTLHKKISEIKDPPKFICDVSNIIIIASEEAKKISDQKGRFWTYLKNISRRVKGNFNPWILNEMLAESILDECITDIAEELSGLQFNFIQGFYNQEFIQQVEG